MQPRLKGLKQSSLFILTI